MKRYAIILVIFLVAVFSYAESVWTGNAAVGGSAEFPGISETYRALSNSFPPGTMLKVTNPRDGSIVDVFVSGRLDTPGIFILMEKEAGEMIGLPLDHVVPVKVTPGGLTNELDAAAYDETAIAEADENLVVPETIITYELPADDSSIEELKTEDEPLASDILVEEALVEDTPVLESPDTPVKEILVEDTSSESAESGDTIFFLMPSDPKPPVVIPEVPEVDDVIETVEADDSVKVPVIIGTLIRIDNSISADYVQIGAYASYTVMEDAASVIGGAAPGYPLGYSEVVRSGRAVYKLLVGPLSPAEVGVILKTARNTTFPDAFRYIP